MSSRLLWKTFPLDVCLSFPPRFSGRSSCQSFRRESLFSVSISNRSSMKLVLVFVGTRYGFLFWTLSFSLVRCVRACSFILRSLPRIIHDVGGFSKKFV